MNLRNFVKLCFSITLVIGFNWGCGGKKIQSSWKQNVIVVDGLVDDWSGYTSEYYEKDDIQVLLALANDDTSLNLMFRFNDQQLARMFERRGIVFWFDGNGKKNKNYGIYYVDPDAKNIIAPLFGMGGKRSPGTPDINQTFVPQGLFNLITQDTIKIPGNGMKGLQAKTGLERGAYCYEFNIPLQSGENSSSGLFVSPQKKIKLCIEIPPVSKEERARMEEMMAERRGQGRPAGRRAGGGMDGGGGRMPGGGMRGGGMRGGGNRGPENMIPDLNRKEMCFMVVLANEV